MGLFDAFSQRRPRKHPRRDPTGVHGPAAGSQLRPEELLSAITANGGPGGVIFGSLDLSDLDLSGDALLPLSARGAHHQVWLTERHGKPGINLIGANMRGAVLARTKLSFARMQLADLRGADLYGADLEGVDLYRADLRGADLYRANLASAKLERADLSGADLRFANLSGANLLRANLDGTQLYRDSLGTRLLQHDASAYRSYLMDDRRILDFGLAVEPSPRRDRAHLYPLYGVEWIPLPDEGDIRDAHERTRLLELAEIYRVLQACFTQQGRGAEASWAYVNERRAERKSFRPTNVRGCYRESFEGRSVPWRLGVRLLFVGRWIRDWAYELLTGYGERAARPFLALVLAFLLLAALFATCGHIEGTTRHPNVAEAAILSGGSLVALNFPNPAPSDNSTKLMSVAGAAVGLALFALAMFTLGNRMRRR